MGGSKVAVRRAVPHDRSDATEVLARAFATDPVMSWLVGPERDTAARLHHLFGHSLGVELERDDHLVDVVDSGQAVALWSEVDEWKTPNIDVVKMVPTAIRTFGRYLPRALRTLTGIERVHPEEPHRYLDFIGVHPDHQGMGFGGALLASMTADCDERGVAAYLESSNPLNEPLYARYGFASRGPIELPSGTPEITAMWRDPR